MNILQEIVVSKRLEIGRLHQAYTIAELSKSLPLPDGSRPAFYQRLAASRLAGKPFFITEFKRKSPSEGWIKQTVSVEEQIKGYIAAGASAISVLTDAPFFGGTYADLQLARTLLDQLPEPDQRPLLLQKDFILDPIQIYLARHHGADLILLIAAILEPDALLALKNTAESLGMGCLVEVHEAAELEQVQHLDFPVLGINNRDLKTFRTALNRVNTLQEQAGGRLIVAESGILDYRHFQAVQTADGFLIGTGLMQQAIDDQEFTLETHFQTKGKLLFKACGIRTAELLKALGTSQATADQVGPDFLGINFSPQSKRKPDADTLAALEKNPPSNAVGVFYQNTEKEILEILHQYPFKTVQCYAGDVRPEFIRQLKTRVILAVKVPANKPFIETFQSQIAPYAADVDFFILDGQNPGSGQRIESEILANFPYPFLLAGGLQVSNLDAALQYRQCIGVDIASGIETGESVDLEKLRHIAQRLLALPLRDDL